MTPIDKLKEERATCNQVIHELYEELEKLEHQKQFIREEIDRYDDRRDVIFDLLNGEWTKELNQEVGND